MSEDSLVDASETSEGDFHPGGIALGIRHTLPFSTDDDPDPVRNAINTNAYEITSRVLESTDDVFEIVLDSFIDTTGENDDPYRVGTVRFTWDVFDEVDWEGVSPDDVPEIVVTYDFDDESLI